MEISFNGFTLSQLFGITDVRITTLPSVEVTSKKVPSRHGTIFQGATIGEREIEIDIYLIQEYMYQFDEEGVPKSSVFNNYLRSIVYYLQTNEPKKLIISDEPDRYYWAICTEFNVERLLKLGTGTIKFLCNDPYLYATQDRTFTFDNTGKTNVDNEGTVETYPRLTVNATSDMNYLAVVTPESVVQIGTLAGEDDTTNKVKKFKDGLTTLNRWSYGSQATMATDSQFDSEVTVTGDGEVMRPSLSQYDESSAPTGSYNYKGTQMLTTLDSQYRTKYFDAKLRFIFSSRASYNAEKDSCVPEQAGAITFHLMDINNNVISRFGMYDCYKNTETNIPYIRLGDSTAIWTDKAKQPKPTTKRYSKVFESEDDVPEDAKLVNSYERTKKYATVIIDIANCPVYKGSEITYKTIATPYKTTQRVYDSKQKRYVTKTVTKYKYSKEINPMTRLKQGSTYRIKSSKSGWYCIYLNSKRTSVGWVQSKNVTKKDEETETVYVYERKIYPEKDIGKYCDFYGYFRIQRKPHSNGKGDIWLLELYRVNGITNKATKLYSKKISEKTGTKYTKAGNIAKIAVSFLNRGQCKPIGKMSFTHLELTSYPNEPIDDTPHLIATKGDVIEIDYSVPNVEVNGESLLSEVDIGSRFDPLQPFMRTEMQISTDGTYTAEVTITEKFL